MVGLNDELLVSASSRWRMPTMRNTAHCTKSGERRGVPSDGGRVRLVSGPNFETAAEIRMMQIIGGDVLVCLWCLRLFQLAIANLKSCGLCDYQHGGRSE